jgi:hypothetical protein
MADRIKGAEEQTHALHCSSNKTKCIMEDDQQRGWYTAPGGRQFGGNMTHFLDPDITAFQADVELGSLWKELPDLLGPCVQEGLRVLLLKSWQ